MNVWINLESAEMVVSDEQLKMIESLKNFIIGGGNTEETLYLLDKTLKGYEIKKCLQCGRIFMAGKSTNYCNRIYKNTKETCQEYSSHIRYREHNKENPIYVIYTTCYNKLYSRVRKGKLEKDSCLFQNLFELRDVYIEKYEQNPSEDVVNEFKSITKQL